MARGPSLFADTKGRPLGLKVRQRGESIVADAVKGLLSVDRSGADFVLTMRRTELLFYSQRSGHCRERHDLLHGCVEPLSSDELQGRHFGAPINRTFASLRAFDQDHSSSARRA